ncbi:MAG: hypothetical protein ABH869_05010 [Candidatus Omnitrophota bacterium]
MGKVLSLLIGTVIVIIGIILFILWWFEFLFVLRGILPIIIIVAGLVAVAAGISEMKDVSKRNELKK